MPDKVCIVCKMAIEEQTKFCPNCGLVIDETSNIANINQNYYHRPADNSPMRVGQYIGMILLLMIPIANIVLLFVWAFSSDVNINKKNLARAHLIVNGSILALYIIFIICFIIIPVIYNLYN